MDRSQVKFERDVADTFIAWYNARSGHSFVFERRLDNPRPDLRYVQRNQCIDLEITSEYYNPSDARRKWQTYRGEETEVGTWEELRLEERLNRILKRKSDLPYPSDTVLLVHISPNLHCSCEMSRLLSQINKPSHNPFSGIYLLGFFGECGAKGCRSQRVIRRIYRRSKSTLAVRRSGSEFRAEIQRK